MVYTAHMAKIQTSVRISTEGNALWDTLAKRLRLSKGAVMERALDLLAKSESVTVEAPKAKPVKRK